MLDFCRAQKKYTSDNPDAPDTEPIAFVFDGEREQVVNLAIPEILTQFEELKCVLVKGPASCSPMETKRN